MSARFRPSPALVVAMLALFVALGGTAFAATQINGNTIIDHTIAAPKLANNTLTGTQINEATLGAVTQANNAAKVGGFTVRRVFYAPATATGTATTLVTLGGLTLKGVCSAALDGSGTVEVVATSASTHAHLSSEMYNAGGGGQADGLHVADFSGQTVDLTDGSPWGETSFTYTTVNGTVVNGQVAFDSSNLIGGNIFDHTRKCLIAGFVTSTAAT